jgi:anti-sigma B factor antagonist
VSENVNKQAHVWRHPLADNDAVRVVHVRGRIDQSLTPQLEQVLNELLDEEHYQVIVDMENATYINSGGLRALVSAWRKARQHDGNLVLWGLNPRLQEIFAMVGFDKVFNIYDQFGEARRAMGIETSS